MTESAWLRNTTVLQSYTRWWVNPEARLNYFYWPATALRRSYDKGTLPMALFKEVVPKLKAQLEDYANAKHPGGVAFDPVHGIWNTPGNEGQEQTISGPGFRTLVQSLMYGEFQSLSVMLAAIGDTIGAEKAAVTAEAWRRRVLQLWNPEIDAFDTLRAPKPITPSPPSPPMPTGWKLVQGTLTILFPFRFPTFHTSTSLQKATMELSAATRANVSPTHA